MSINANRRDMGDTREAKAREAGEILYNSLSGSTSRSGQGRPNGQVARELAETSIGMEGGFNDGRMSAVRRTFCLIITFDLIFSFVLWVIYTQVANIGSIPDALRKQVEQYNIKSSLFDSVLAAASRFTILLLSYALFRSRKPWFVAITTAGTCAFLVAKAFLFSFSHGNAMDYIVLIVAFLIAWIETWFLDFKVLPREQKARERAAALLGVYDERTALLGNNTTASPGQASTDEQFKSLPGSDDEDTEGFRSVGTSRTHSRSASRGSAISWQLGEQEQRWLKQVTDAFDMAWQLFQSSEGWQEENNKNSSDKVYTKQIPGNGKIFKIEALIECEPEKLFGIMWNGVEEEPRWNPTVLEGRVVQSIDDRTDVVHTVAAEAAGGMVSSRDFVSLRHWQVKNGMVFSGGCSTTHPDIPVYSKYVRGENGPGCWAFAPVKGKPKQCRFTWILNTMPKGWLPQYLVDQALSGHLTAFVRNVRKYLADSQGS